MTVPATARRAGPFNGNGSTTAFPFTFKVFSQDELEVVLAGVDGLETTQALTADYTVTLNPDQDADPGGTITMLTAPATGETLVVTGALDYEQTLDLPSGGNFSPRAVENAFDRTVIQIQQLAEQLGRSLTLPVTAAGANTELPVPAANKVIAWNSAGTALVNVDTSDLVSAVVAAGSAYTDVFNGTGAQTAFALTADPGSVDALDVSISGVVQVNGVDFTVSGTTLTFTSAPPAGTGNVVVRYVAAVPVGLASYSREKQTATAGQTVFSLGTSYTPDASSLAVIVDGLIIPESDYDQTDENTVTFNSPLVGGEEVEFLTGRVVSAGLASSAVSFEQAGSGYRRTVQTKLRSFVSSGDYLTLQEAVDAAANGVLFIEPGYDAEIAAAVNITSPVTILGYGAKLKTATNITGLNITSSGVRVFGLEIEGAGNSSYATGGRLVSVTGVDGGAATAPTRIADVVLRDMRLFEASRCGVYAQFVERLTVENCRVHDVGYAGVELLSVNDSRVHGNHVTDVSPGSGSNTYGVYASQVNSADTVRHPVCSRVAITGNVVTNVQWEGIDCHGGDDLDISHNVLTNCGDTNAAIGIIHADDETSTPIAGARRVRVIGNTITGAQNYGIATSAAAGITHDQLTVTGNTLYNCGLSSAASPRGAIRLGSARHAVVEGNTIDYAAPYGVVINDAAASNVVVTGNTFSRVVSNTVTTPAAVLIDRGASGTGPIIVGGNSLATAGAGETYEAVNGVRVVSTDGGNIRIDTNHFDAATTKYSITAAQTERASAPVANFGEDTIAVTTSVATASKVINLANPHSANTVYAPFAVVYGATGNTNVLIHAVRTSASSITVTVYTADGANFGANGDINFYFQTVGY